jgi:hypothetical protein
MAIKMAQGRSRQEELLGHASLGHLGPPGLTEQGLVREFLTETHQVPKKSAKCSISVTFLSPSVADPDPPDPHVVGPPGSGSGSISQRHGSGSGSFYH